MAPTTFFITLIVPPCYSSLSPTQHNPEEAPSSLRSLTSVVCTKVSASGINQDPPQAVGTIMSPAGFGRHILKPLSFCWCHRWCTTRTQPIWKHPKTCFLSEGHLMVIALVLYKSFLASVITCWIAHFGSRPSSSHLKFGSQNGTRP